LLTEYGDLSSRPRTSRVWSSVLTGCGQALLPPKGRGLRVPHESTARTGFWHFEEGAVRAWSKASRCVGPVQVRCVSIISSAGATDASNRKSLSCGGRFHLRRKMKIANLRRTCGFMHLTGTPWALRTRPPVPRRCRQKRGYDGHLCVVVDLMAQRQRSPSPPAVRGNAKLRRIVQPTAVRNVSNCCRSI
jgi:hypothetical protein